MEGDKEEAGKEKVVVERRSDLRTMMVDGGIEEAAMVSLLVSLWSERERIEFCVFCILYRLCALGMRNYQKVISLAIGRSLRVENGKVEQVHCQ